MVISTCRHCRRRHLIADNEKKLDLGKVDYGLKIEDFLRRRGDKVTKLTVSADELRKCVLLDKDGELTLVAKSTDPDQVSFHLVSITISVDWFQ
jgi:hypothetical protein